MKVASFRVANDDVFGGNGAAPFQETALTGKGTSFTYSLEA